MSSLVSMILQTRLESNRRTSVVKTLAFLELSWDSDSGDDAEDGGEDCDELHDENSK